MTVTSGEFACRLLALSCHSPPLRNVVVFGVKQTLISTGADSVSRKMTEAVCEKLLMGVGFPS